MNERGRLARLARRARLLAAAWRLHGAAQPLARGAGLSAVRAGLRRCEPVPAADPVEAIWAATWTARAGRRLLGRLDTCLVRSLVAGTLIRGDHEVALHIGVHPAPPAADRLDGHAWLTVDGGDVGGSPPPAGRFETVHTMAMTPCGPGVDSDR